MELFPMHSAQNLIPKDGEVYYFNTILSREKAEEYFQKLLANIPWQHDEVIIFSKKIITKRKTAWFGDQNFEYTYSNNTKRALPWTNELLELKNLIQEKSNETFNSCLLNLYHDGNEGMSWHSDNEPDLKENGTIASLSLGAERTFQLKHKLSKETIKIHLAHTSLLLMKGEIQKYWLHQIPVSKKITTARINLTFRTIVR